MQEGIGVVLNKVVISPKKPARSLRHSRFTTTYCRTTLLYEQFLILTQERENEKKLTTQHFTLNYASTSNTAQP